MAEHAHPRAEPFLILPGFMPDAMGFAFRTTLALLLAYFAAFAIQLDSASSAGLCVAIVAQPTPGMALSKAVYRAAGTILGGAVALALVMAFPQDRTMLLICFTLWLGACTFVAALLRDFRSYGAVLCGYTVGIIAVTGIDAPDGALLATLNRVAAILLGIGAVALVNLAFSRAAAFEQLVAALRARLDSAEALARTALAGKPIPSEPLPAQEGAEILALRTEASYAAVELPNGAARSAGAEQAIAGLLGMLSATRAIATGLSQPVSPAMREAVASHGAALGQDVDLPPLEHLPHSPLAAALLDRARELLVQDLSVRDGLRALETGLGGGTALSLPFHRDVAGALLSAARTMIAVGLGCVFCVYSGVANTTGLLVQQAAFTALLGMGVNPVSAGMAMGYSLVPAIAASWFIGFVLLPAASGFVPFALAVGSVAFVFALVARHPATTRYGAGLLLYLTLLLAPANTESFDLTSFVNNVLLQMVAVLFMILAFELVLPVSPRRRLARVARAMTRPLYDIRLGRRQRHGPVAARTLRFDRLAQAQLWLGRMTPARLAVLRRLSAFAELESCLRRAQAGIQALGRAMPPVEPDQLEQAAHAVLQDTHPPAALPMAMHAAAGLYGSAVLLRRHGRALRRYHASGA